MCSTTGCNLHTDTVHGLHDVNQGVTSLALSFSICMQFVYNFALYNVAYIMCVLIRLVYTYVIQSTKLHAIAWFS